MESILVWCVPLSFGNFQRRVQCFLTLTACDVSIDIRRHRNTDRFFFTYVQFYYHERSFVRFQERQNRNNHTKNPKKKTFCAKQILNPVIVIDKSVSLSPRRLFREDRVDDKPRQKRYRVRKLNLPHGLCWGEVRIN